MIDFDQIAKVKDNFVEGEKMRQKPDRRMKGLRGVGLFFVCVEVALSGSLFCRNKAWVFGAGYFSIMRMVWVCVHGFCKSLNLSKLGNSCLSLTQQQVVAFVWAQWISRNHIRLQVENSNLKRLSYLNEVLCFRGCVSQLILRYLSSCGAGPVGQALLAQPSLSPPFVDCSSNSRMPFGVVFWLFEAPELEPFVPHDRHPFTRRPQHDRILGIRPQRDSAAKHC